MVDGSACRPFSVVNITSFCHECTNFSFIFEVWQKTGKNYDLAMLSFNK